MDVRLLPVRFVLVRFTMSIKKPKDPGKHEEDQGPIQYIPQCATVVGEMGNLVSHDWHAFPRPHNGNSPAKNDRISCMAGNSKMFNAAGKTG